MQGPWGQGSRWMQEGGACWIQGSREKGSPGFWSLDSWVANDAATMCPSKDV